MRNLPQIIWHGSLTEADALQICLNHNCTCSKAVPCGAHSALLDQRFIDGILFARAIREQLLAEEGVPLCKSPLLGRTP